MNFINLLKNIGFYELVGTHQGDVEGLSLDSRAVSENFLYAAVHGTQVDGHQFIDKAIAAGAKFILCNDFTALHEDVIFIKVENVAKSLGLIAANFYNNPSNDMKVVAITGTNGKTTCATLLYELFSNLGYKCGLISTVEVRVDNEIIKATHTTPNSIALQEMMAKMLAKGCEYCFMEASSHAIVQERMSGVTLTVAGFTNLSHDHLDYHKTFDAYRDAKKKLFDELPTSAFCISNKDDKNGVVMLQNTKASKFYYALTQPADFKGKIVEMDLEGMLLSINEKEAWYRLTGKFNASNLLLVYGIAFLLEENTSQIITALSKVGRVKGRFELIKSKRGIIGIIDYAHTPDALINTLNSTNGIRTKNEQLFTVFGCGGNRDKAKRPVMGKVAAALSDKVIITSDNPRNENPEDIIQDIVLGIPAEHKKKAISITAREQAILTAVSMAQSGDIILIAGKGHEDYQEIMGVKYPFDDKDILEKAFNQLEK